MFEQTLLLENGPAKKTGAFAASLGAQTIGVAILLLIPLVYNERLPYTELRLTLPMPTLPRNPEPVQPARPTHNRPTASPRPFQAPVNVPTRSPFAPGPIEPDSSLVPVDAGAPGPLDLSVISISTLFRQFEAAVPRIQPPPVVNQPQQSAIPVGGDVQAAKLIKKIVPVYPHLAQQARVSGIVHLMGVVAKDGTIQKLQVLSGHPLLIRAALDAVQQWVYRPTRLNGEAVEVIAPIDVIFTLAQ